MSIHQMISMGGYGIYVWPAYCITFGVFAINFVGSIIEKKQIKKTIQQYWLQADKSS